MGDYDASFQRVGGSTVGALGKRIAVAVAVAVVSSCGLGIVTEGAHAVGGGPLVRTFAVHPDTGAATQSGTAFEAFPIETSYGAHVAAGSLDGDDAAELAFGTTEGSTCQVAEK